ncbi:MAG: DNA translocase FtsK [Phycisphaerales bacterium]|nr:MAG: DNA translocase FtsK [Phycisphaerales bacterium]
MTDASLTTGPRRLLRLTRRLTADRAERELSIATRETEERARIDRELESGQTELREKRDRRVQKAESEYESTAAEIQREFERDDRAVREAYEADREQLAEKAETNEGAARKKMEEAIWLTESVYEGSQDRPEEQFEQSCKVIDSMRDEVKLLRGRAEQFLKRSRLGSVAREPDRTIEPTPEQLESPLSSMDQTLERAKQAVETIEAQSLPKLFRSIVPIFLVVLAAGVVGGITLGVHLGELSTWVWINAGLGAGGMAVLLLALYIMMRHRAATLWQPVVESQQQINALHQPCVEQAEEDRDRLAKQLRETRDREVEHAKQKYGKIIEEIRERRAARHERIEQKYPARLKELAERRDRRLAEAKDQRDQAVAEANTEYERDLNELESRLESERKELTDWSENAWAELIHDWKTGMQEVYELGEAIRANDEKYFPDWDDPRWNDWSPPREFAPAVRFGRTTLRLNELPGGLPDDERLKLEGPTEFTLPATLAFPNDCSMLIEHDGSAGGMPLDVLQTVMFRLLTCLPPGKARFTIIDPVGLGQSFAGFMHLADHSEALVGAKIWTDQRHIEQRLIDITEHMESVIQKYLRNEFETIDEYNEQAGEIAEPYRFLVIADFPTNFSESAMRRLASVMTSGARCGVYTLILRDTREKMPSGLDLEDLRRGASYLLADAESLAWKDEDFESTDLVPDKPPAESFLTRILHIVGEAALEAGRVEVPFQVIAPPDEDAVWSRTTESEFKVALGRAGATKLQSMTLGRGTAQHVLIAGKTGSGKSTLLHALITNLALWYSPDEAELYLVDFKKGVEFKTYATHRIPHLRAVAVESDREFGLSVLQRVDQELSRRGERYRQLGVQDLAGFRKAAPDERMPRTLLIIDEFQEIFVEDDKIAQDAAMLLDRLVRQGRAFGIHVLLGSQTLGGAYSLARSTIGQMAVRIALQCSETDSYLILSDDNAAARLLSRPGEAIYNDANGMLEGNSPFQVVWLPDSVREQQLKRVENTAQQREYKSAEPPIVFEGNVPADLRENHLLQKLIRGEGETTRTGTAWFGEAIAIKDPTAAVFRRQSGHNLLMVGQQDEAALAIFVSSMIALGTQHPESRFFIFDGSAGETSFSEYIESFAELLPRDITVVKPRDAADAINEIHDELKSRETRDASDAPPLYLVTYGIHRFRDLRHSEDFSFSMDDEGKPPSSDKLFATILREGPNYGLHTLAWCDTVNNVNRTFDRAGLREFEMRILFQMSPADSSFLIDAPSAGKLGFHRGLFSSEEEGVLEKFRPYALPPRDWLESVRETMMNVDTHARHGHGK